MKKDENQKYFNKEILENFMKEHNLTKKQFAKFCEISVTTLNKLLSENVGNLRMDTMHNLLKHLKVSAKDLFGF
ncbi:MAG: helix-turn-helix domain-containing protein [Candidatus Caccovivens sp.]